jgi:hypothetical protein
LEQSGGNVGVGLGSTNPSTRLHVNGTIRQTNSTNAVLVSDGNGDIGSASNLQDVAIFNRLGLSSHLPHRQHQRVHYPILHYQSR